MTETYSPSAETLNRGLGYLLLACLLVTGIIPLSLSFLPQVLGVLGCLYLWMFKRDGSRFICQISPLALLAIPTLALVSSIWSVTVETSFLRALKVAVLILSYVPFIAFINNLPQKTIETVKSHFAIPLIILGTLLAIELNFNFPIGHLLFGQDHEFSRWELNKQVSELLLLTPMALFFCLENRKRRLAFLLCALNALIIYATASQAAQLAVVVMILVTIGVKILPRLSLPLFFLCCIILLFGMPWISTPLYEIVAPQSASNHFLKEASANARLEIWYFISEQIMKNPWMGLGIDATRSVTFSGPMVYYKDASVLHPHNVALQLWIEFGIFGPILGSLILFLMYLHIKGTSKEQKILSLIVLAGTTIFLSVSWSIWSSWLVGLVMMLITFTTARTLELNPKQTETETLPA